MIKVYRTTVGRCDLCREPAAYVRVLSANRRFLYCEKHATEQIKRQAEETARAEQPKK